MGDQAAGVEPYPTAEIAFDAASQLQWVSSMSTDAVGNTPEADLGATIVEKDGGEVLVLWLSRAARDILAKLADDPDIPEAEEMLAELTDPDWFVEDGQELIKLAGVAKDRDWSLYCWMSV